MVEERGPGTEIAVVSIVVDPGQVEQGRVTMIVSYVAPLGDEARVCALVEASLLTVVVAPPGEVDAIALDIVIAGLEDDTEAIVV